MIANLIFAGLIGLAIACGVAATSLGPGLGDIVGMFGAVIGGLAALASFRVS